MSEDHKDVEGEYGHWAWNEAGKFYVLTIEARIYPIAGEFVTSYDQVWNTPNPTPKTFKEAELAALGITPPKKDNT